MAQRDVAPIARFFCLAGAGAVLGLGERCFRLYRPFPPRNSGADWLIAERGGPTVLYHEVNYQRPLRSITVQAERLRSPEAGAPDREYSMEYSTLLISVSYGVIVLDERERHFLSLFRFLFWHGAGPLFFSRLLAEAAFRTLRRGSPPLTVRYCVHVARPEGRVRSLDEESKRATERQTLYCTEVFRTVLGERESVCVWNVGRREAQCFAYDNDGGMCIN